MEDLSFALEDKITIKPRPNNSIDCEVTPEVDIIDQTEIWLENIPLLKDDPSAFQALMLLKEKGYTGDQLKEFIEMLDPMQVPLFRQRQAKRSQLDEEVKRRASQLLKANSINPYGHELDRKRLNLTNFVVIKSSIDRQSNDFIGKSEKERHDFSLLELGRIFQELPRIVDNVSQEFFGAEA